MNASSSDRVVAPPRWTARVLGALGLLATLVVWGAMSYWAWIYVSRYASPIPFRDDLELALPIAPGRAVNWDTFWHPANEHRIALPRFIYLCAIGCTRDFRSGMYFQVIVLSLLALALVFAARALRGRSSPADAFFPLSLLHWGNSENLMLGMQITIVVPAALVMTFVLLELCRPRPQSPARAALMGACLLLLPLNGGFGLMQVPPLVLFALLRGWSLLRQPAGGERAAGAVFLGGALATCLLIYYYFVDFEFPKHTERVFDLARILWTALQFLSMNLGPIGQGKPVLVPLLALVFPALALVVLARAWRSQSGQRWQVGILLAGMAAAATIALAIGVGRGSENAMAGLADRYVILPAAWYACAYLALCRFAPRWPGWTAQAAVALALAALLPFQIRYGKFFGNRRHEASVRLQADVIAGVEIEEIARVYSKQAYPSRDGYLARLLLLRSAGFPPFRAVPGAYEIEAIGLGLFDCQPRPVRVISPKPTKAKTLLGLPAVMLRADSDVVLAIPPGAENLEASYGMVPSVWKARNGPDRRCDGLRVLVEWHPPRAPAQVLFEHELDPRSRPEDGGVQSLHVELPPGAQGEIVLAMRNVSGKNEDFDWGFWSGVALR